MKLSCLIIISLLVTVSCQLLAVSCMADYVDSVVLIPNADGEGNTFTDTMGCYDHYDCVNDSNDAPCTGDDTITFVFSTTGIEMYGIVTASDTSNSLDSMALYICAAEYKSGTGGADSVEFGWRYKSEGQWYYCNNEGGMDTMAISGHACVTARTSWTNDPCWGETRGLGWVYFGGFYNNDWQLAVHITSIEGGCFPACLLRLFNIWMVYYVTVTEAPADKKYLKIRK